MGAPPEGGTQDKLERGAVQAGSSAAERLRESRIEMAGPSEGGGRDCISCRPADWPRRGGTEESVSTVHGRSGQTGLCFDFHLQYQGEPWCNPQTSQQADSTQPSPGAFIIGLPLRHAEKPAPEVLLPSGADSVPLMVIRRMPQSCGRSLAHTEQ